MSIFEDMEKTMQQRRMEKSEKLRKRNAQLRAQGKEPIKSGWGPMIDTGLGGLNRGPKGTVDLTGQNLGTENYFSNEQRDVAEKATQRAERIKQKEED